MIKYSIGLDISAKDFSACISTIDLKQQVKVIASSKFSNNLKGFKLLIEWKSKHCKQKEMPITTIMEATGIYYENIAYYLYSRGYNVSVVLPLKAKKYMQSLGLKSKNDKIDAKGLSKMGAEQCLEKWEPMDLFFYKPPTGVEWPTGVECLRRSPNFSGRLRWSGR